MPKMVLLGLPNPEILEAFGQVSVRHGQLDYALRLTIKSLTGLGIIEVLNATNFEGSSKLREQIKKLAKKKIGEGRILLKLKGLLERARKLTEQRNGYIHTVWGYELDGEAVMKDENHHWGAIPTKETLLYLAEELDKLTKELITERLEGELFQELERLKAEATATAAVTP